MILTAIHKRRITGTSYLCIVLILPRPLAKKTTDSQISLVSAPKKQEGILGLPLELRQKILSELDAKSFASVMQVCQQLYWESHAPVLNRAILYPYFHFTPEAIIKFEKEYKTYPGSIECEGISVLKEVFFKRKLIKAYYNQPELIAKEHLQYHPKFGDPTVLLLNNPRLVNNLKRNPAPDYLTEVARIAADNTAAASAFLNRL